MKHIIWLTPGFAASEDDSKCIPPLQLLARQLQQQPDVCLHIIAMHYPQRQVSFLWHNTRVYPAFRPGVLSKIRIWWRAWAYLRQLLKAHPTSILHSFWLNDAALLGHWANRLYKVDHWITLMGQDARPDNKYLRLFPLRQLKLVTLSKFHDDQLFQTSGRRGDRVIPWGIDNQENKLSSPMLHLEQNSRLPTTRSIDVLGVGNLIDLKNYALFIEIIAELKETFPDIQAMIIGDGVERKKLEQLTAEQQLGNQLTFTGALERTEVLAYMRQSRIFLHTSTYESFGYVLLEALSSGAQVVSTPVGIAADQTDWPTAQKRVELVAIITSLLREDVPLNPTTPYPMQATMQAYLALY